jgi:galactosyl transferase GMA12/MNN10 family
VSRALVTFATGGHRRLLDLALPGLTEYADRHGYRLLTDPPVPAAGPASWFKLPALVDALHRYDEALWVDSDIVVVDGSADLAELVPDGAWQALVRHHTADGEVPNCGVWYVRRPMLGPLEQMWALRDHYRDHPWWEQAALMQLLGYRLAPAMLAVPTRLYRRTCWLGGEWNSHTSADPHPDPRFVHATHGPLDWRVDVMRLYTAPPMLAGQKGA